MQFPALLVFSDEAESVIKYTMTLEEYEQTGKALYANFADAVKSIFDAELKANGSVRVQVIQMRAKASSEVRKKLEDAIDDIETKVKDLAGVRIVVYSNSDIDRLVQSGIIPDNFEIEWDRTKFHYPHAGDGTDQSQFIGRNYVLRLKESRAELPEYKRFAGLQCEVQVQTILDHAWSETAHDTIYKSPKLDGVGTAQMAKIKERMRDIQQKYLRRAGYEFQQVLNDFEHIVSGQRLVDSDILAAIREAQDNNVRFELLEKYATVVLPIIDDKAAATPEIRSTLIEAARNAQSLAVTPIETPIGSMSGRTHEDVLEKIISILADIRYINPADAYTAYADLYLIFDESELQQKIAAAVGELARHNLAVWQRFGPGVQEILLDAIATTPKDRFAGTRPLMIEIAGKCLESEVTGTSSTSTSVTLETSSIIVSDRIYTVRDRATDMLKNLFNSSQIEGERSNIYHVMQLATCLSNQGCYSDLLLERVLQDTANVTTFFAEQASNLGGLLKQTAEHGALFHYRSAKQLPTDMLKNKGVRAARDAVVCAAIALRERFNSDDDFVVFKTLVGFESVFAYEWDEDEARVDFKAKNVYRKERAAEYLAQVTEANADEWFDRVNGYASIESNDLAMFPQLGDFVAGVAEKSPVIAESWLGRSRGEPLAQFTTDILRGLYASDREAALRWISAAIDRKDDLSGIAHFIRFAEPAAPNILEKIAHEGIAAEDESAAYKVLEACAARPSEFGFPLSRKLAIKTLIFLSERGCFRWTEPLWLWGKRSVLLAHFNEADRGGFFAAICHLPKIDYRAEQLLAFYAETHAAEIIDLFGARLERERAEKGGALVDERFKAIPFNFSRLHKSMQHAGPLLLPKALAWHRADPLLGQYKSARLVANMFPELPEDVISQLIDYAKSGDHGTQEFVINVMSNYEGAPVVFTVIKELVAALPGDDELLSSVIAALGATGVTSGEFGRRDAIATQRERLASWLADEREPVKKFANEHIKNLDNAIATAQQVAETDIAMRKLTYGEDLDGEKSEQGDVED